jgi:hypothetical protein
MATPKVSFDLANDLPRNITGTGANVEGLGFTPCTQVHITIHLPPAKLRKQFAQTARTFVAQPMMRFTGTRYWRDLSWFRYCWTARSPIFLPISRPTTVEFR